MDKKFISKILFIGVIIFIVSNYFYQICFVHGISMEPTLKDKEVLLVKKYNLKIKKNDIVLINKNKNIIIKRVVGIPEDKLIIKDNYLYVNNKKNDELYIKESGLLNKEIKLKENEYFVLGDNRQNSIDSRNKQIGLINKKNIIGIIIKR